MMSLVQFIDGQWLAGEGKPFESKDPARNEVIWQGEAASAAQVDAAVKAARAAGDPAADRAQFVDEEVGGRAGAEAQPHARCHQLQRTGGGLLLEIVGAHGRVLTWPVGWLSSRRWPAP